MDELNYSQNSYYPYTENFIFNQTNSTGLSYLFPTQTIPTDSYFPGMNNPTGESRKEDKRSSYTSSNEFVYWDDKSLRPNNLPISKIEENNPASREAFLFQTPHDRDKCKNYQNRKMCNHYNLSNSNINFDYTSCAEMKNGKKTSLYDETTFNKYNDIHNDGRLQPHKKCMFESSYCVNTNSCLGNETTIVKEMKDAKYELPNNSNYYEYCDDYPGLGNYFGLTNTPNISELDVTDQQSEDSNGESDIIVEELEEENYTGVQENLHRICSRCVVCKLIFVPQGVQFYYLTLNSPVTMTSQRPVFILLKSLIRNIKMKNNYICCECLGLLNTIDHFQSQLDNFKSEFMSKFKKSADFGNLRFENSRKHSRKAKQRKSLSSYYRCKYCKKTLYFKNYCHYHIMKHKRINILCEKCGILCKSSKMFYKHICIYSKISKPSVMELLVCSNCNKFFKTKVHLKEHQNSCLGILPHICDISNCGKKFATSTRLKNHVKLKHDKKFIAICSICNIGFIKISDYKSHKVIHSNDKKFQCQKCEKSYKTISNLNFHLKSHKQSLPFICNICGKGFMRKEYLETHINNHKGITLHALYVLRSLHLRKILIHTSNITMAVFRNKYVIFVESASQQV